MKKFVTTFLAISILASFLLGCANIRMKPDEVKCPQCGATIATDEAEKEHLRSLGFGEW